MCIRDRIGALAGYMGSGDVTLMLLFTAIEALGQGPWPVSYTHLDVYKKQP